MNTEQPFDWYEDPMEVESAEFQNNRRKRNFMAKIYDFTVQLFSCLSLISGIILFFRFLFRTHEAHFDDISLDTILLSLFVYMGSLCMVNIFLKCSGFLIYHLTTPYLLRKFKSVHRWIALTLWYLINFSLLNFVKADLGHYYFFGKAYIQACLLGSVSFTVVTITMDYFYEYFIVKTLFAKMKDVDISERAIVAMKSFRYEMSDSSSVEAREFSCIDFLCMNSDARGEGSDNDDEHVDLGKFDESKVGDLTFKPPELQSVYDAKTLAKDVYQKATDKEQMDFESFSSIFPSTQIALQAFSLFETDEEKKISKKDFRDTIIRFFVDRLNLEKNFIIAKGFVGVIGDILSIVVLGFLILAWLVIFGIPLKDLVALALSSALLLNFLMSGVATDLYYNFMVVLSHPFDIGDDVIIDGTDYRVYQMGVGSSSFLGINGGKIKFMNSELWKKGLINMTRSPEKVLVFQFNLPKSTSTTKFAIMRNKIQQFLKAKSFDFYETFSFESKSENSTGISVLECSLILKYKGIKSKTKKMAMRIEVTRLINDLLHTLGLDV